jgi:hypothetical protein
MPENIHPDQADPKDPNRVAEAKNVAAAEERAKHDQAMKDKRTPDYDSPEAKRGNAVGGYFGGVTVAASSGLRDTSGAKYVAPRHSASGEWESGKKKSAPKSEK